MDQSDAGIAGIFSRWTNCLAGSHAPVAVAVNAFGFSGTLAHVLIEATPLSAADPAGNPAAAAAAAKAGRVPSSLHPLLHPPLGKD
eukprot:2017573-Pyramimonas_sp.AAC.1